MKIIMKLSVVILTLTIIILGCQKVTPTYCQNPKTNFRVFLTGDSHAVNSWPLTGGYDSIWANKIVYEFRKYYDTVTFINMATAGGRTVGSGMPMWYQSQVCSFCQAEAQYSIDTILKQQPDLILLCFTGNHTVNHMTADEAIYCFKYIIDTLRLKGIPFVIAGQTPRKKTFTSGMTIQGYYDSSRKINDFIESYAPKSYVNNYNMEDLSHQYYPIYNSLCSDSLHFSDIGNQMMFENFMNTYIVDSSLTDFPCTATKFDIKKSGSNIVLNGDFKYRKITVSGSNDYSTFTEVKKIYSSNAAIAGVSSTFADVGYLWYKVEVLTGRLLKTITKKLN